MPNEIKGRGTPNVEEQTAPLTAFRLNSPEHALAPASGLNQRPGVPLSSWNLCLDELRK